MVEIVLPRTGGAGHRDVNLPRATGPQGPAGPAGPQGPEGPAGPAGPEGPQGSVGPKGDKGDKGDQGLKGDTGDTGPKGDQGVQGIQGVQGPKGDKGDPGDYPLATVAEIRAGLTDSKVISPKRMADALAPVVITRVSAASGLDFATFINASILLDANLTIGGWINKYPGATGIIRFKQDATGGRTVAWASGYIVPANFSLQATANGVTDVPYLCEADNKIRLYNPSKWA